MINTHTILYDDPMWKMDKFISNIMMSKYPNNNSVINDDLRYTIEKCFDINLTLFDTHKIMFTNHMGQIVSPVYYVYEGPYEKVQKIMDNYDHRFYNIGNHICGQYPDGILLGFFSTEFKDPDFRKSHMRDYAAFIYHAISIMVCKYYDGRSGYGPYMTYIDTVPLVYLFARMDRDGIPINNIKDITPEGIKIYEDPIFNFGMNITETRIIMENIQSIIKLYNKYDWCGIYNILDKEYHRVDYTIIEEKNKDLKNMIYDEKDEN